MRVCTDGVTVPGDDHSVPKSVVFIPLSPTSSRTLQKHHQKMAEKKTSDTDEDEEEDYFGRPTRDSDAVSSSSQQLIPRSPGPHDPSRPRSRRLSDPSHNRGRPYTPDDSEEDVVELLPDRFDAQGTPLDRPPIPRMFSREGDFVYRSPPRGRGKGEGWNVAGKWGVAGTDDKQVNKIVRRVTEVVEGRGSVLGLLGGILSGSLLESGGETEDEGGKRRRARDVEDGRSRRRLRDIEDPGDSEDERESGGSRRRRRRRGSG
jgi:hypothetical protein